MPFGRLFRRIKRSGHAHEELLSVYRDYGVVRKSDRDDNYNKSSDDLSTYQLVEPGDLAINKMKAWQGSLGVSSLRGIVSPAYFVFDAIHEQDSRFLHYLLRSPPFAAAFMTASKGIRINQWDLDPDLLKQLRVPLPPEPEQAGMVAFLDRESSKIDTLVEEQYRLIELLKEKRRAAISDAVTKGLDATVSLKDSGVEWLGEVPDHWDRTQLGRLCRQVSDGPHFSPVYADEGILFLSARNIRVDRWSLDDAKFISEEDYQEFCRRVTPEPGDLLYTKGGTTGVARVVDLDQRFQVWVHVAVLKIKSEIVDPYFLAYSLNGAVCYEQAQLHTRGATNNDLGLTRMVRIWLTLPPMEEQQEIVRHLDNLCASIDALISSAEEATRLLQERRAALISAAVTGKIDVYSQTAVPAVGKPDLRLIVGSAIVGSLARKPTFGRVKFQKLLFLAEVHVGIGLGGRYTREAAGPLDRNLVADVERRVVQAGKVDISQPHGAGGQVEYRPTSSATKLEAELAELSQPAADRLKALIGLFADFDTRCTEAVTTLYAVWNDALIDRRQPTTKEIVHEVLNGWHPEKKEKFQSDELETWLGWMDRHGLVPTGTGPKTQLDRFFA
jgi:type I restriction enzyme S subunit